MRHLRMIALAGALALGAAPAQAVDVIVGESPAGIPFWLVEEHAIPIVSLQIEVPGGARLDPAERPGASRLMSYLFDEGAGEMDAAAFNAEKDRLAARYGFSVDHDSFTVSAQMLSEELEESIRLLAVAISDPRLDAEAVERMRALLISGLLEEAQDPNEVAWKAWAEAVFPDHPYGIDPGGTPESVAALTIDDLRAAHGRLLQRAGVRIGIVGDITEAEAGRMLDILFADVPEGAPREFERMEAVPPPGVEVVELDVPQSVAIFGQTGLYWDDEDFITAYVMNHIIGGGGFASRLMEEVREKRGLAYGVYSYLSPRDSAALLMGGVQTANERVAESLDIIRAEFARLAADGVTEEELDKAQRYLTGAYPLRFDTNAKIARILVGLQSQGLGPDYINERNSLIEAVTVEDIRRVAAGLLDPDAFFTVVVGRPEGL